MRKETLPEEAIDEQKLEDFIQDWHWDTSSHHFARALGKFLFQFLDRLSAQGISARTIRKHCDNCWSIGIFECQYGYRKTFVPSEVFVSPKASYEYAFRRKMSASASAIKSYRTTWRKLHKYTQAFGHLQDTSRPDNV